MTHTGATQGKGLLQNLYTTQPRFGSDQLTDSDVW